MGLQTPWARSVPQQHHTYIRCQIMFISSIYDQASQRISHIKLWTMICSIQFLLPTMHTISETSHACYTPCQPHLSWFYNLDIIWWILHLITQCNELSTVITQFTYFTQCPLL
jgi:hypothetical protein